VGEEGMVTVHDNKLLIKIDAAVRFSARGLSRVTTARRPGLRRVTAGGRGGDATDRSALDDRPGEPPAGRTMPSVPCDRKGGQVRSEVHAERGHERELAARLVTRVAEGRGRAHG